MVTDKNYAQLGFKSPDEVRLSTLGEPVQEFMVRLDHLREYKESVDPNKLLIVTKKYVYPVTVDGQVRSSIELLKKKDKWIAVSFGAPNYIRMVTNERARQVKLRNARTDEFFIVRIPAFRLHFIGYRKDKQLMLIPLFDILKLDLHEGVAAPAEKVFLKLVPAAKKHDGLPR
jgi:hypothetical protein